MKKIFAIGLLIPMLVGMLVLPAMAQVGPGDDPSNIDIGIGTADQYTTIGGVIGVVLTIVQWLYTILFIVAVLFIIFAAYNFVTSSGDEGKVDKAKKQLLYAVIGVAVALLAFAIVQLVQNAVVQTSALAIPFV